MQLCIENVDQAGGCGYGYSCVYTDTISWASPTRPLPMMRDPRVVFDTLFGVLRLGTNRRRRGASSWRRTAAFSTGCWRRRGACRRRSGPAIARGWPTISTTCARSSGASRAVEACNLQRRAAGAAEAPAGVPDSFSDHVKLMFDLQVLAFASDVTRVFAFKLGRDNSNRDLSGERLQRRVSSDTSHHSGKEDEDPRVREAERVSREHDSVLAREAEEHARTATAPAGQHAAAVWVGDGRFESAQPQARAVLHRRPRRRRVQGRACI